MKISINLTPIETIRWLERQRQLRLWSTILLATSAILGASTVLIMQKQRRFSHQVDSYAASVAHIRAASEELTRLTEGLQKTQHLVNSHKVMERRDVPLALLRNIVLACRGVQNTLQIRSIKFSELQGIQPAAFTGSKDPRISDGPGMQAISLQLFLHGLASPEDCGRLLAALRESRLFREVDLVSAQAVNDSQRFRQTFQIRCDM